MFALVFLCGGVSMAAPTPESCFSGNVINGSEIEITRYDAINCGKNVEIPSTFQGKPVTKI